MCQMWQTLRVKAETRQHAYDLQNAMTQNGKRPSMDDVLDSLIVERLRELAVRSEGDKEKQNG